MFFGQKRVACFRSLPQTPADAAAQPTLQRLASSSTRATKVFSDWVFDVQLLTHDAAPSSDASSFPLVAVGLAHNFVQIWDPTADRIVRSVQCAERCILYALSFHGRRLADLVVASGTVFQQILLWQPCADGSAAATEAPEYDPAVIAPSQRLHSHDGVLFKLEWSRDASMLASVSDDRTVQLWSCRDASAFPAPSASRTPSGFLTTTEQTLAFMAHLDDATDQVADIARPYCSVFRSWGHTARLWDVKFCAYGLVTTSEDAVCKLWDFAGNCIASLHGHMGRHVWRVAVHPSRAIVATGGSDSAVKLWNVHDQIKSTSSDASAFCETIALALDDDDSAVASTAPKAKSKSKSKTRSIRDIVVDQARGDRAFVATERGQILEIDVPAQTSSLFYALSSRDSVDDDAADAPAPPMLSAFASNAYTRVLLTGDSTGRVSVIDVATATATHAWRAHDSRVVKIVAVSNGDEALSTLLTVCADCTIREWQFVSTSDDTDAVSPMTLVATYKSPGKCAASSLLVVDRATTRNIVCGDGRGNVFVFQRSLGATDAEAATAVQAPSLVLRSVHGREQVASLLRHDNVIYSGGHDGYICTHVASFSRDGALSLALVGRESIKGMATVKQLWLSPERELFVLGFYASHAILHNATAQLRLFNVECGGWRRPHALVTQDVRGTPSTPAHTFLFTPPVVNKTDALELKVHSTLSQRVAPAFASPPLRASSLHYQFHGKMTTCVVRIGDRLVTAAEDNGVKLHVQQPLSHTTAAAPATRWTCVSTGVAHTTTVRALTAFRVSGAHVLLSGGGKERINVWRVLDNVDVIEHVCGFEKDDAVQDQRILGLATFALRPHGASAERYRLVAACNSEGAIQLLLLDLDAQSLRELGHVRSSHKPILSCAGFQHAGVDKPDKIEDDAAAILAVGATDGVVTIWSFAGLVRELERSDLADLDASSRSLARMLSYLVPVEAYDAHDMGVNCLAIAHYDALSFSIVSGGDDQNVRLREYASGGESLALTCDARAVNASGSAIKAIYSDGAAVFIAGYDQRVSKWAIVSQDNGMALAWQCAVFAECADIANLAVWTDSSSADASAYEVIAVGQGLQAMRFRK